MGARRFGANRLLCLNAWRETNGIRIRFDEPFQFLIRTELRFKVDIYDQPFLIGQFKCEHQKSIARAVGLFVIVVELDRFRSRQCSRRFCWIVDVDRLDLQSLDIKNSGISAMRFGSAGAFYEFRVWHERVGYIEQKYKVAVSGGDPVLLPPKIVQVDKLKKATALPVGNRQH